MENRYDQQDIYDIYDISKINTETLNLILKKLNENKITRHHEKKIFRIGEILSTKIRTCKYVGTSTSSSQAKSHLQVKFISPDEKGIICVSILTDKYCDLI
jgi:hypothetical protein